MFKKRSVGLEMSGFYDACSDTAVGVPEDVSNIEEYIKKNNMEAEYLWFGAWLFDNVGLKKIEREIEMYCKKELNGWHMREASYQVYCKYYREYKSRTYNYN